MDEARFSRRRLLQPFRGAHAEGVHRYAAVHEAVRLREVHGDNLRGQRDDTRLPQREEVFQQGVRRPGQEREGHDGMVSRLQAPPDAQRPRGHHNVLSHRG